MTTGAVFNIQRFSTEDGPGIRTTVFMKGCPLRCIWCHNPESQSTKAELLLDKERCIGCGGCAAVCERGAHIFEGGHRIDRTACVATGKCVEVCPSDALRLYGKRMSVDEALGEVMRDKIFYETSGGGVTLSGGEPLFQPEFASELLKGAKESGIHTAIETSGFAAKEVLLSVIGHTDLVLFDVKETDPERHKRYTGVPIEPILSNLRLIDEVGVPFVIRAPIIPSLSDREEHFKALSELCRSMKHCIGVEVMPYHNIGVHKYEMMDKEYLCGEIKVPERETVERWRRLVEAK